MAPAFDVLTRTAILLARMVRVTVNALEEEFATHLETVGVHVIMAYPTFRMF
ncbi:MAG: hypothetical protein V1744_02155 [Candidatus Altiarchaeota archaeon]